MGCFISPKGIQNQFLEFLFIFSLFKFEQKVAKNVFFVIFSKTVSFGQNLALPMCSCEIPFLKMYTFMYFYEFVKKLYYKIKMPKCDV